MTGASRGIGRSIATELAAAGASVVALVSHRRGGGRGAGVGDRGRAVQADVSDPESARALVEEAGDVDILVNNAGVTRDGLLVRMSDDDWNTVIDTNLASCFYTCRAAARGMMKKRSGTVVNISSIVGIHGNWGQTNYAASKAGIIGFTKSLARELGSRNVRANVVVPGYVKTQLTDVLPEEATEAMLRTRRSDASAIRTTSQVPCASSARTRRRSSPVRCCSSTAGWGCRMADGSQNGRRRVVITGVGMVTPARKRPRVDVGEPHRRGVGGGADHALRHDRLRRPLRLRAEGLRSDGLDRPQAGTPHGPVLAARADRCAHGGGGLGARHRSRARSRRRRGRDRDRRPLRLRGLLPEPARARARPDEPVRDRPDHPEHGRGLGLDGARRARARSRPSAPPAPRRTWRSATASTRSGSAART